MTTVRIGRQPLCSSCANGFTASQISMVASAWVARASGANGRSGILVDKSSRRRRPSLLSGQWSISELIPVCRLIDATGDRVSIASRVYAALEDVSLITAKASSGAFGGGLTPTGNVLR
jgi:hypothetical protein